MGDATGLGTPVTGDWSAGDPICANERKGWQMTSTSKMRLPLMQIEPARPTGALRINSYLVLRWRSETRIGLDSIGQVESPIAVPFLSTRAIAEEIHPSATPFLGCSMVAPG